VTATAWRQDYRSWGGVVSDARHLVLRPANPEAAARALAEGGDGAADGAPTPLPALAWGCGRSYGDVALNPGGRLLDCRGLDRFVSFDRETGILTCEAGVQLADIFAVACRPEADGSGWFLPVTPGTRFVTVGGAIANDVHGKNHHRAGTFGRHLLSFELARSDGTRMNCSPTENGPMFAATIGGLGLTGVVLRATLRLRRVEGMALEAEDIRFGSLDEFFALAAESDAEWEYTAAWIDCLAGGEGLGRGIFSRARHAAGVGSPPPEREPRLGVPATPPWALVTGLSVRAFNNLYWRRMGPRRARVRRIADYAPVLYPLDSVGRWNRLYGPGGFYQFQCVVPPRDGPAVTTALLQAITAAGEGSMLSVLKVFGDLPSPGLLSFPMPGVTLALDFANRGEGTRRLLARLEAIVSEAGGRLYPAKDSLMSSQTFQRGYPRLSEFLPLMDPGLSSAFARRVGLRNGNRS
jgi:FAD/FMN-containing dehydrogenase